jgi:hypothetical protein
MTQSTNDYRIALKDDESLSVFLRCLKEFDQNFCDLMFLGADFTHRLEVRGDKGKLIHSRVSKDHFDKPDAKKHKNDM